VEHRLADAINTFDCNDNEATNTVECISGSSYVEVDQPSFTTISRGVCLPACGLSQTATRCRFNPVFRRTFLNDTSVEPSVAPEETPSSVPAVEPPASEVDTEPPETSEPSVEPEATASEPSVEPSEPAIEPDASEPSVEPSEPAIEPDASEPSAEPSEPAIEPEEEVEPPGSEPLPDAPESEVEPPESDIGPDALESEIAEGPDESLIEPEAVESLEILEPLDSVEGPEAMESVFAPESDIDICETIRRMRADIAEDSDEELFDSMIELPEECLEPSAAPSAFDSAIEPEPELEPEPSVPASEPSIEPLEEDIEEPEIEPEPSVPASEPAIEPLEEDMEEPEMEPEIEPEVPPESAPAPTEEEVEVPVTVTDSSNRVFATDWGECSQFCQQAAASATRERTVLCRNAFGLPLPAYQCDPEEFAEFESTEDCQLENCATDGSYFVLGPWSACSSPCAEFNPSTGELDVGVQTRQVNCFGPDSEQLASDACVELVPSDIRLERPCNSNPCEIVVLDISEWSRCSCDNGTQTRTVRCSTSSGEEVGLERCEALGSRIPRTTQECDPPRRCERVSRKILQTVEGGSCDAVLCSNRGECDEGRCICDEGFGGDDCQLDLREEPSCPAPGILGPDGSCCQSGVFDLINYECCRGDNSRVQLDIDGACCEGRLDNCGVCNGNGVLDSLGRCCTGTLDGNGFCCFGNNIDECGVCDGDGSSCITDITATFEGSQRQIRRRCAEPYTEFIREALDLRATDDVILDSVSPVGIGERHEAEFTIPGVQMDINSIEEALVNQSFTFLDQEPQCAFTSLDINKHPVCGNGICEIGEAPSNADPASEFECQDDCSMEFVWCDLSSGFRGRAVSCSGHGLCLYANNGQCDCFTGYAGANCELCAPGFYRINDTDSRCFPRQNFVSILSEPLAPPPTEPPTVPPAEPPEEVEPEVAEGVVQPDAIEPEVGATDETDPSVITPQRRGFATINAQNTLESDDDDADILAIVLPVTIIPFVLFLFVVYHYARKRNQDSTRETDLITAKRKEAAGYPPTGGHHAKSESAMWKEFVSKLRPAARPTASRRRGLERLVNRSFQDSPSTSRSSQLRAEGGSPGGEYGRDHPVYLGGTRGIMEDVTSPQSSLPSPAEVNPRAEPRRRGIMDVRKWDSRKQSIKGSSALITVESNGESGSEHDELISEEREPLRVQPRSATEIQGTSMVTIDEADRDTQVGVASSMEIHGVPSETARTADTQSLDSD